MRHILCFVVVVALGLGPAYSDPSQDKDTVVKVHRQGDLIVVDADYSVPATPQEAWSVLTDFDHMAEFLPNLQLSKVVARTEATLQVAQRGKAVYGPLFFTIDNVREVELTPFKEIRFRLISGNMRRLDGTTELVPADSVTRIHNHAESIPDFWVPPIVGLALIKHAMQEQIQEIRHEILRRKRITLGLSPQREWRFVEVARSVVPANGADEGSVPCCGVAAPRRGDRRHAQLALVDSTRQE